MKGKHMLTYSIRIDDKLKRPVVIYIHDKDRPTLTLHRIRAFTMEDGEREAREWVRARGN
jgi:hypothetical protein